MTETVTIDTLAADLQNVLGSGWKVTAFFDRIVAVTPLCDRIEITPLAYSYTQICWALVPMRRSIAPESVQEIAGTDLTASVATSLRNLSFRHFTPPAF